ncbi:hypothetical protein [uncultured Sphingomonas sp.]|nr:hypothetical protein [uncultured Sphingomonas sp.]
MTDGALFACTIVALIWVFPSIARAARAAETIAAELRRLRELAERGRR